MCLSFFQIKDLGQSRSQKDTYLAFSFLFPRVLLSYQHHSKAKFRMYFAQPSFCIFEWCVWDPYSRSILRIRLEIKKLENEKGCNIFSIWFQSPIWLKREQGVVWWCFMIRMKRKLLKGRSIGRLPGRPLAGLFGQAFGAEICGGLMCVKVLVYAAGDALLFTFGWDH